MLITTIDLQLIKLFKLFIFFENSLFFYVFHKFLNIYLKFWLILYAHYWKMNNAKK